MDRAPINAMVFPYRRKTESYEFEIFNRADSEDEFWQGIWGGAEDDETPIEAARRASWEEAWIDPDSDFIQMDSICSIPTSIFRGTGWGDDIYVVHEHAFGVDVEGQEITLSHEHTDYRWVSLGEAFHLLKHDSNRAALGEFDQRLTRIGPDRTDQSHE